MNGQKALGRIARIRPQLVVSAVSHRPPRLRPAVVGGAVRETVLITLASTPLLPPWIAGGPVVEP